MRVSVFFGALAASLIAGSAFAATLLSSTPTSPSTLGFVVLDGTEDLSNNEAPYANGGPRRLGPFDAYLFDEGTNDGVQSFLLHYDRNGGVLSIGNVSGSFVVQLASNQFYLGARDKFLGLLATDPSNGVQYQNSFILPFIPTAATLGRGTESPDTYNASYDFGLNQLTVNYNFTSDGIAMDEVRFGFAVVPEPATWAMMIGGFGLAGAMLRRRQLVPATA